MNKIIDDLNWRYATKAFDTSKKVSKEDLDTIIEAFRLSASSFGLQPWKLVVVQNQDIKDSLVEHSWGQGQIANCSDLLVFARKNDF
jgi:nitroreductase